MLAPLIRRVEDAASRQATNAVLGLGALVALTVGIAFLTLAAWLLLLTITSAAVAALIIGATYSGGGMILFALIGVKSRAHRHRQEIEAAEALRAQQTRGATLTDILAAFISGMNAGRKTKS